MRLHTCEPVSMVLRHAPLPEFQKRIVRSAVPPPEARTLRWKGHQASALTAAQWSVMTWRGAWVRPSALPAPAAALLPRASQRQSMLSLPPEARVVPSWFQARPHTSCWCPSRVAVWWSRMRTSWLMMAESRPPLESKWPFHASELTRLEWPSMERTFFIAPTSHICTTELLVPTERYPPPSGHHLMLDT